MKYKTFLCLICIFVFKIGISKRIIKNKGEIRKCTKGTKKKQLRKLNPYLQEVKIFISTHKDFQNRRKNEAYIIIADDKTSTKNNYSLEVIFTDKNNDLYPKKVAYGEISKINYIYQYYRPLPKYIGLNHYGRYFEFLDNIPDLDKIFQTYDAILPPKKQYGAKSVYLGFISSHIKEHLDTALNILKVSYPEYLKTALHTMNSTETYYKNLFIMKSEDFLPYIKFLRTILDKFDEIYNFTSDKDVRTYFEKLKIDKNFTLDVNLQSRCQGFIAERLSAIYFTHNFKNPLIVPIAEEGHSLIYLFITFFFFVVLITSALIKKRLLKKNSFTYSIVPDNLEDKIENKYYFQKKKTNEEKS